MLIAHSRSTLGVTMQLQKRIPIKAVAVSIGDVKRIFSRLDELVSEERQRAAQGWVRDNTETKEDFEKRKTDILTQAFRVTVTIMGADGSQLFGDDASLFDAANNNGVAQCLFRLRFVPIVVHPHMRRFFVNNIFNRGILSFLAFPFR
jgi:hypothetical protein